MNEAGMGHCAELWEFHDDLICNDNFAVDQGDHSCWRCIADRKTCDGIRPCKHCKKAAERYNDSPVGVGAKQCALGWTLLQEPPDCHCYHGICCEIATGCDGRNM